MAELKRIRENLSTQVLELEVLQSVYPDELRVTDHGILADINEFISEKHDAVPQRLEYNIKIVNPEGQVDVFITLPTNYPGEHPEIYARSSSLNRIHQAKLNEALIDFVNQENQGESCVYTIISWIQDNLDGFIVDSKKVTESEKNKKVVNEKPSSFIRYWVYSHHIYSNTKRKDIIDMAKENSLSGFCLAGKPGIICVEGVLEDCEYWWQKIKAMNWHKILLKLVENENIISSHDINTLRKFLDFHEISFPTSDKHNDMGQLFKYLTEHNCQHVFKEFFGVEGKIPS